MNAAMLAINWEPELRGILIVIIAVAVLMGSIYLDPGDQPGRPARLPRRLRRPRRLVVPDGRRVVDLRQGLLGPAAAWKPVADARSCRTPTVLYDANVLTVRVACGTRGHAQQVADQRHRAPRRPGLEPARSRRCPSYQQAGAAATTCSRRPGHSMPASSRSSTCSRRAASAARQLFGGSVDFLAFWHKPHYALVEVAPLVPQRAEPGRAPAKAVIDPTQPHQYVFMVRDLGALRQPAGLPHDRFADRVPRPVLPVAQPRQDRGGEQGTQGDPGESIDTNLTRRVG